MLGVFVAVVSSLCFGANSVFVRRGTPLARPRVGVLVTLILGPPMFLLVAAAFGQLDKIGRFSSLSLLALAAAGVIHFVVGRSLNYNAVGLLGASRGSIVANMSSLISVGLAVLILGERMTTTIIIGALLMVLGPILIAQRHTGGSTDRRSDTKAIRKGMALGLTGALCYGMSPLLIKFALQEASLPLAGSLVSYVAAFAVLGSTLLHPTVRQELLHSSRAGLLWYAAAGMAVNLAQLFRYVALSIAPVSLVAPLLQLSTLFTLFLSITISRRLEVIDKFTISGAVAVVAGAVILTQ